MFLSYAASSQSQSSAIRTRSGSFIKTIIPSVTTPIISNNDQAQIIKRKNKKLKKKRDSKSLVPISNRKSRSKTQGSSSSNYDDDMDIIETLKNEQNEEKEISPLNESKPTEIDVLKSDHAAKYKRSSSKMIAESPTLNKTSSNDSYNRSSRANSRTHNAKTVSAGSMIINIEDLDAPDLDVICDDNNKSKEDILNDVMSSLNLPDEDSIKNDNYDQDKKYNAPKISLKSMTKQKSAPNINDDDAVMMIHDDEDLGDVVDPESFKE
eukprot:512974_1